MEINGLNGHTQPGFIKHGLENPRTELRLARPNHLSTWYPSWYTHIVT